MYKRLLINAFKTKLVFRLNYLLNTLFSFLYILLQVFIWKGLYGNSSNWNGIMLNEMIAYTIFSNVTSMFIKSNLMKNINNEVQDGSISLKMLLPCGYRTYYLKSVLSENLLGSIYNLLPPILIAVVVFGVDFKLSVIQLIVYVVTVFLAFVMNFTYSFVMGLSVVWFRNSFFLENVDQLVFKLFSGAIVPMWFFPSWLNGASFILPFRYMIFEPISILLGVTPRNQYLRVFTIQIVWIIILILLMQFVWAKAQKHIMIQGG